MVGARVGNALRFLKVGLLPWLGARTDRSGRRTRTSWQGVRVTWNVSHSIRANSGLDYRIIELRYPGIERDRAIEGAGRLRSSVVFREGGRISRAGRAHRAGIHSIWVRRPRSSMGRLSMLRAPQLSDRVGVDKRRTRSTRNDVSSYFSQGASTTPVVSPGVVAVRRYSQSENQATASNGGLALPEGASAGERERMTEERRAGRRAEATATIERGSASAFGAAQLAVFGSVVVRPEVPPANSRRLRPLNSRRSSAMVAPEEAAPQAHLGRGGSQAAIPDSTCASRGPRALVRSFEHVYEVKKPVSKHRAHEAKFADLETPEMRRERIRRVRSGRSPSRSPSRSPRVVRMVAGVVVGEDPAEAESDD
ncbi:hypothetical protein DFP72DRAFT_854274 [Ephemerocybe angulata]|uniref:Uncharacterized protein n=1 Tax=Ephemerocybe angulata TaxID=980116 RepID=A0A8H6HI91_9AGAR|nr:hypothetical protein DFP72DRAFT_854274 [Tulosesus angulatus]